LTAVYLQQPLAPEEIRSLKQEFPEYKFLLQEPDSWREIEILYGARLSSEQLSEAALLRWIHVPSASLATLPTKEIEETTNLLVTNTKDPDVHQIAEWAIATLLAFGKDLFEWHRLQDDPPALWDSPARSMMWSLHGRTLLQVGLGRVGSAIAQSAQALGMRTWGVKERKTFHPYCQKTYSVSELHSLLPAADVISIAIPRGEPIPLLFKRAQLELMRDDAILIILGSEGCVDEEALAQLTRGGKFRGVAIDAFLPELQARHSPLWNTPGILVTPNASICPEPVDRLEFRQFLHNLRRYIHNDFDGMKNLLRAPAIQI
jgi:phosphoglycerate dehydrogenase-like enzyme